MLVALVRASCANSVSREKNKAEDLALAPVKDNAEPQAGHPHDGNFVEAQEARDLDGEKDQAEVPGGFALVYEAGTADCSSDHWLATQLTVLLVTSPIRAHPDTSMLEIVLSSLVKFGTRACRVLLVFDGIHESGATTGRGRKKGGEHSEDMQARYLEYQNCVRALIRSHPAFTKAEMMVLSGWHCFSQAVEVALRVVTTPYVLVMQHDWKFVRSIPIKSVVRAMISHSEIIKYVTFPSEKNIKYIENTRSSRLKCALSVERFEGVPLIPLFFWYDRNHVAQVKYYNEFVLQRVRKKGFFEDILGHQFVTELSQAATGVVFDRKNISRHGSAPGVIAFDGSVLKDVHCQYNTWMLYDEISETDTKMNRIRTAEVGSPPVNCNPVTHFFVQHIQGAKWGNKERLYKTIKQGLSVDPNILLAIKKGKFGDPAAERTKVLQQREDELGAVTRPP
eukprot:gb/GEZN01005814.1/.p1 GENE.gb/GEZN01005814.1/~~gb/GEZN01005814.1/.p1  ORF type:complete len:451 (-),score=48.82 gb/GEZN01005814.1/:49-1401(-)